MTNLETLRAEVASLRLREGEAKRRFLAAAIGHLAGKPLSPESDAELMALLKAADALRDAQQAVEDYALELVGDARHVTYLLRPLATSSSG